MPGGRARSLDPGRRVVPGSWPGGVLVVPLRWRTTRWTMARARGPRRRARRCARSRPRRSTGAAAARAAARPPTAAGGQPVGGAPAAPLRGVPPCGAAGSFGSPPRPRGVPRRGPQPVQPRQRLQVVHVLAGPHGDPRPEAAPAARGRDRCGRPEVDPLRRPGCGSGGGPGDKRRSGAAAACPRRRGGGPDVARSACRGACGAHGRGVGGCADGPPLRRGAAPLGRGPP